MTAKEFSKELIERARKKGLTGDLYAMTPKELIENIEAVNAQRLFFARLIGKNTSYLAYTERKEEN